MPNDIASRAKEIWENLAFFGSHERAGPLADVLSTLSGELFWRVLYDNWQTCDAMGPQTAKLLSILVNENRAGHFSNFMPSETADWYADLPEELVIYRGASALAMRGLSWTTDRDVATQFARGHRGILVYMPTIFTAKISKEFVLAAFDNEREVVIPPERMKLHDFDVLFTSENAFSDQSEGAPPK